MSFGATRGGFLCLLFLSRKGTLRDLRLSCLCEASLRTKEDQVRGALARVGER